MFVGDIIRRTANSYPNKLAIVFGEERLTWREVNEGTNRVANSLRAYGLRPQDRVGILMANCSEFAELLFGIAKGGLVSVCINPRLPRDDLLYEINHAELGALVVDEALSPLVKELRDEMRVREVFGSDSAFGRGIHELFAERFSGEPETGPSEEDLFCLAYTSGTTGKPKAAMITHRNMLSAATTNLIELRLLPHHNYLCALPMYPLGGLTTIVPSMRGCTMVIRDFEPRSVLETIQQWRINAAQLSTMQIEALLQCPEVSQYNYSSLQVICCVGSVLPQVQVRKAVEVFGNVLMYTYGMTETVGAGGTVLQKEDITSFSHKAERLLSIGRPKINVDIRVVDETGHDVDRGTDQAGEILVRGEMVMRGYWKRPEDTSSCLRDSWFFTGDLARVDGDGFIYPVGRRTEVIVKGKQVVSPHEVEEVIGTHPGVREVAVVGTPAAEQQEIVAFVVAREGHRLSEEEIALFCQERLPPSSIPARVRFVSSLPKTDIGKVIREELRGLHTEGEKHETMEERT